MTHTILIKYAEIALKGRNRRDFERRLIDNIKAVLGAHATVTREYGRVRFSTEKEEHIQYAEKQLRYVFGVHSFAHATIAQHTVESIVQTVLEKLKRVSPSVNRFAVVTRRSDKRFPKNSQEMNILLGSLIQEQHQDLVVDLNKPELTVYVEIREKAVYVYTNNDEVKGPGGLPVGVTGKGLALFSGGLDSPVATWSMMKRGLEMDAVYFHSPPYTGEKTKEKILDLARVLSTWRGGTMKVFIPLFGDIQTYLSQQAPEGIWTILFRRSMQRIAEALATSNGYTLLVTGDSMAQVASQTPENLSIVNACSSLLTVRPLISFDKQETINLAHRIGTYDISTRPYEDCCTVFTPARPRTKAKLSTVESVEAQCSKLPDLEKEAIENAVHYFVSEGSIIEGE